MNQKAWLLTNIQPKTVATIKLDEKEDELKWDELFAHPRSEDLLASMADKALVEARARLARAIP